MDRHFNPRSPCGERPAPTGPRGRAERFQSTLSLRRATLTAHVAHGEGEISIHALLAESDSISPSRRQAAARFQSTLSLRRATLLSLRRAAVGRFQSTLSLRRATPPAYPPSSWQSYFNPRSPCGERPGRVLLGPHRQDISIHALLAESDPGSVCCPNVGIISIHALLAESDQGSREGIAMDLDFNPRSPCGERRIYRRSGNLVPVISIHALLAESDRVRGNH